MCQKVNEFLQKIKHVFRKLNDFLTFGLTECAIFIIFTEVEIESHGRRLLQVDVGAGKLVTTHEHRVETI